MNYNIFRISSCHKRHKMNKRANFIFLVTAIAVLTGAAAAKRNGAEVYDARMADWRNHQVVYQVFVDRFAPSGDPQKRAGLYTAPRRLLAWNIQPRKGEYVEEAKVYQHEIDFWGGDLRGLTEKLDYIKSLGANVLYLNPIFLAYTNHKYDTTDYFTIDPQYGSQADFERLCNEAHARGMRVVLDGVFNHTGRRSIWFQEALKVPSSRYRDFFYFDPKIKNGYRGWVDLENLPELNYDNPAVRDVIYRAPDSVVQQYLAHIDGWRLDVAFDLGPQILSELTAGAHRARPGSYTVGEIYNYPSGWFPALDGVMNMYMSRLLFDLTAGKLSGPRASEMIEDLIEEAGIEPLLKSWIVLSNHDRSRLKSVLPELKERAFIIAIQVALPGSPLVYYGEELGMAGMEDPEQRGPMDWELVKAATAPETKLVRSLLEIRNNNRALKVGDFVRIPSERLFAFTRHTASVRETVVVVANPTNETVSETISPRDSFLMDVSPMRDLLGGASVEVTSGLISVKVPPKTVQIFVPVITEGPNYNRYKRVE
jgi:cyclomaltodextrinase / maltogenic alpha-amylase / neopullulanase